MHTNIRDMRYVEKYYIHLLCNSHILVVPVNRRVPADRIYTSLRSNFSQTSELFVIKKNDCSIEYVERTRDQYLVHKTIPKHWLLYILSAN